MVSSVSWSGHFIIEKPLLVSHIGDWFITTHMPQLLGEPTLLCFIYTNNYKTYICPDSVVYVNNLSTTFIRHLFNSNF